MASRGRNAKWQCLLAAKTPASGPRSPPQPAARAPPPAEDAEPQAPLAAGRCRRSGTPSTLLCRGTARAISQAGNQASVILEKCQFAKPPPHLGCQPTKLRVLPSFYLGRRGPAGRSEERPALPARPASCSPGCPGSWSRGNTPEIARKAWKHKSHSPSAARDGAAGEGKPPFVLLLSLLGWCWVHRGSPSAQRETTAKDRGWNAETVGTPRAVLKSQGAGWSRVKTTLEPRHPSRPSSLPVLPHPEPYRGTHPHWTHHGGTWWPHNLQHPHHHALAVGYCWCKGGGGGGGGGSSYRHCWPARLLFSYIFLINKIKSTYLTVMRYFKARSLAPAASISKSTAHSSRLPMHPRWRDGGGVPLGSVSPHREPAQGHYHQPPALLWLGKVGCDVKDACPAGQRHPLQRPDAPSSPTAPQAAPDQAPWVLPTAFSPSPSPSPAAARGRGRWEQGSERYWTWHQTQP